MADDSRSPATKQDIKMLMDEIGKLYDANMQWKDEMLEKQEKWKDEMLEKQEKWKDEIVEHFDVVAENIHHDTAGANRDEISILKDARRNHEERITTLEKHTGLVAA